MDLREIVEQSLFSIIQTLGSQRGGQEGVLMARTQGPTETTTTANRVLNPSLPSVNAVSTSSEGLQSTPSPSSNASESTSSPLPGPSAAVFRASRPATALTHISGLRNDSSPMSPSYAFQGPQESGSRHPQENVTARVRHLFRPYDSEGRARNSSVLTTTANAGDAIPSTSRGQTAVNLVQSFRRENPIRRNYSPFRTRGVAAVRTIMFPVVYLGDPSEENCPDGARHLELSKAKLGKTIVTCKEDGSESFLDAVMATFVHETQGLYVVQENCPDFRFELLYLIGSGTRCLIPLKRNYKPMELKTMGIKTLYARPTIKLLAIEVVAGDEDGESSCSSSEFYEVVGRGNPVINASLEHNTSSSEGEEASEIGASPSDTAPPPTVPAFPNSVCEPPPVPPVPQPVSNSIASVPLETGSTATPSVATPPQYPFRSIWPRRRSQIGFRPDVTTLSSLPVLRDFLFRTSAQQSFEIPQLGPGIYPLSEISRFMTEINPEQETRVRIQGEQTIDGGGPLLSYIWKLSNSIRNGDYHGIKLLYGTEGNLTLSSDKCLVQDNVMAMLARFTSFSIINTEVGIRGLSRLTVKILASTWWPSADDIAVADIYDPEAKLVAESLQAVISRGTLDWDKETEGIVKSYLRTNDWGYEVTLSTASKALDFAKINGTVTCREASLLQFREAFLATDVGTWVAAHQNKWDEIFPERYPRSITADEIMSVIDGPADFPEMSVMLYQYFHKCETEGKPLSKFVEAVTGYPYIMNDRRISVQIHNRGRFFASSTCFAEFRVFRCSADEFDDQMDVFMAHADLGFNAV